MVVFMAEEMDWKSGEGRYMFGEPLSKTTVTLYSGAVKYSSLASWPSEWRAMEVSDMAHPKKRPWFS